MAKLSLQSLYHRLPIPAQQLVISVAGWRSYRARFGAAFKRALVELEKTDRNDADAVIEDQAHRLRQTIRWAASTVPYYRNLFRRERIDPESIRSVEDLARIPHLDKEAVRAHSKELLSEALTRVGVQTHHTSGTTGTALRIFRTQQSLAWEYAVVWRQRRWFGVDTTDRFASFGGQTVVPTEQSRPPFWRYDWARSRMLFSLYHMSDDFLEFYARELARPGYTFWQGYPSSIGVLCEYLLDHGVDLGEAAPKVVFTSSETLLDFHRKRVAHATGAPVADRYGHTELAVSVVQCPEGSYHLDTEFGAIEIDPHEETDDWVRGELVATGFANRAMPFLRYRTGDVATLMRRNTCPCGRARPILEGIDGRVEDYVVTPEGRRVGRMDHIFKDALSVKEAQILQSSPRKITVRLVPRPDYSDQAQHRLEREFRVRLGSEIEITYELTDSIPREESGKFRMVISTLDAGKLR